MFCSANEGFFPLNCKANPRKWNVPRGLWFFSKKIFWFSMLLKKIFWLWWREKKIQFLSYNLMLNSGKKNCALRDKKINILTLVLSEEKILNETINLSSFLNSFYFQIFCGKKKKRKWNLLIRGNLSTLNFSFLWSICFVNHCLFVLYFPLYCLPFFELHGFWFGLWYLQTFLYAVFLYNSAS